jgi:alpha-galactosidase
LIHQGDLYRLESPYEHPRAALSYVSENRAHAVVFIYQLRETAFTPVKPRGLDPARLYRVREINLPEGRKSRLGIDGQLIDGATLMAEGLTSPLRRALDSAVIEFTAEPQP